MIKILLILIGIIFANHSMAGGPMSLMCDDAEYGCNGSDPIVGFLIMLSAGAIVFFGWIYGRRSIKPIYIPTAIGMAVLMLFLDIDEMASKNILKIIFGLPVGGLIVGWVIIFFLTIFGIIDYSFDDNKTLEADSKKSQIHDFGDKVSLKSSDSHAQEIRPIPRSENSSNNEEKIDFDGEKKVAKEVSEIIGSLEYNEYRDRRRTRRHLEREYFKILDDNFLKEDNRLKENGGYWLISVRGDCIILPQIINDIEKIGFVKSSIRNGWYLKSLSDESDELSGIQNFLITVVRERILI